MNFDDAVRLCEILMAWAFILQSLEHLKPSFCASSLKRGKLERGFIMPLLKKILPPPLTPLPSEGGTDRAITYIFFLRLILSIILISGFYTPFVCLGLFLTSIVALYRYQGPYNGGSDRIGILIIFCLCLVHWLPNIYWQEIAFGYLALQVILSYFIAGWVKWVNPEWRNGKALQDVFLFSAYPRFENLRGLSNYPTLLFAASWLVILFELLFPISFLMQTTLIIFLTLAALFHLANFYLFGLNRFFWIWIASYPSILWLQERLL